MRRRGLALAGVLLVTMASGGMGAKQDHEPARRAVSMPAGGRISPSSTDSELRNGSPDARAIVLSIRLLFR